MSRRFYVGLSSTFHDPAVAIVDDAGEVRFAEAIERPLQDKRAYRAHPDHFVRLPRILSSIGAAGADLVVGVSFSGLSLRLLQLGVANDMTPLRGLGVSLGAMIDDQTFHDASSWPFPTWRSMRLMQQAQLVGTGQGLAGHPDLRVSGPIRRYNHHLTHAAYACRSSPFSEALCAVVDGFGEFGSTGFFHYKDGALRPLHRARGPMAIERASLGMFYGLVTGMCGFSSIDGEEWKIMGLAPYGSVDQDLYAKLRSLLKVDGLSLAPGLPLRQEKALLAELRGQARPEGTSPREFANVARTGQQVFADVMGELLANLHATGLSDQLVLSGGCALNSSYNGQIVATTPFSALHVPSAPADDGNAVGAAWLAWAEDHPDANAPARALSPYLGSGVSPEALENAVRFGDPARVRRLGGRVFEVAARLLAVGKILGWMQGAAEFGPRALGHRSILADPRSPGMKDHINARVKFREEYRPFAPSILDEHGAAWFEDYQSTPYMERTLRFRPEVRDRVPAVVHEDGTGRLQSVSDAVCPRYAALVREFHARTGVPIVLNTSFNIMGKPILHSVEDALGMFHSTGLDALIIEDVLFAKSDVDALVA